MPKNKHDNLKVAIEDLRWIPPDAGWCAFESTKEVPPCTHIIGQDRAQEAIMLGLEAPHVGYNIFITGHSGTGRMTTIQRLLEDLNNDDTPPDDWCYVNNFADPDRPIAINLKAGKGKIFRRLMNKFVEDLVEKIPLTLESDVFQKERSLIAKNAAKQREIVFKSLENKVREAGFTLGQYQIGGVMRPVAIPLINDKPTSLDDLAKDVEDGQFPKERFEQLTTKAEELGQLLADTVRQIRKLEQQTQEIMANIEQKVFGPFVKELIEDIKDELKNECVNKWLDDVVEAVLDDIDSFKKQESKDGPAEDDPYWIYRVNLIVDNSNTKGKPIIVEGNPTFKNLFGTIEKTVDKGTGLQATFANIKAGSMMRANGGFIIINALDTVVEAGVWSTLKRALRNLELEIQNYDPFFFMAGSALNPHPIPLNMKVILVGNTQLYYTLWGLDEEFKKIFKVHAPFDIEMPLNEDSMCSYASFIRKIIDEEKLIHFDRSAVKAVLQESIRLSGQRNKLCTQFLRISDLLRETNIWAKKDNSPLVTEKHVLQAIDGQKYRLGMYNEKLHEQILEGTVLVKTEGTSIGQINGLAVYDLGQIAFGKPTRISARIGLGKPGVVNIEREADMSGPIHNKAVLILTGYLQGKYAKEFPLAMTISLGFEQNYGGIEGDSATAAEIITIISAIADIPIKQNLAITGSVNQHGEIQPIGGANEKIEGFFALCRDRGLTGEHGVVIPKQNIKHLMLDRFVTEAVKEGKFHIWAISNVEEALELMTGLKAGELGPDGTYPPDSINGKVLARLKELYLIARKLAKETEVEKHQ